MLRIQRDNYERNQDLVRRSLGSNAIVAKYGREYHRYLKTYQGISSKSDLLRRVLASDVVYHGDYHTLRHSQRSILAMLQELAGRRELILCLEMFHGRDQKWVDLFMAGSLEEKDFLHKIGYARKWAYNWNPWRHILDYCREHAIPVLGINREVEDPERSLFERDIFSAQVIGQALVRYPGALVYVVDGDYHISPNHLPREVDERLAPLGINPQRTIIYQNAENLYWKLAEEHLEEADVLQITPDSFCLMNTVPATKLQSYLDWLEYAEDGYFPVRGNWAELSGENYFAQIQNIIQNLDDLFQLRFQQESLERLTVYSSRNLDFTEVIQSIPALRGQMRRIKAKIRRSEGFLLEYREGGGGAGPQIRWTPTSSTFPTPASTRPPRRPPISCIRVLARPLGETADGRPRLGFDYFYANVLTEALGFFGSKMINEKRKAPTESGLRVFLGKVRQGWESPNQAGDRQGVAPDPAASAPGEAQRPGDGFPPEVRIRLRGALHVAAGLQHPARLHARQSALLCGEEGPGAPQGYPCPVLRSLRLSRAGFRRLYPFHPSAQVDSDPHPRRGRGQRPAARRQRLN